MSNPWYRETHWRILLALAGGVFYGCLASVLGWSSFTNDWISPFGAIFLRLLLLVSVPLVLASLITGIASLSDLQSLSRIGGKAVGIYLATTLVALLIGLGVVNVLQPGTTIPDTLRSQLQETYEADASDRETDAQGAMSRGPLQALVDMVPQNIFGAASNNRNMLNVVFVAFLFGVALMMIPRDQAKPMLEIFESLNAVAVKIVELVIKLAPVGVFSLMAGTISNVTESNPTEILQLVGALGLYCVSVLLGLALHTVVTYSCMVRMFSPLSLRRFFGGIVQSQLVAFSTSSSAAALPVTMKNAKDRLGVSEEVSSFVLPLGATINMDGTALYQAVAAVFIAQTLGVGLDVSLQLTIVFMAMLASIGTAAVPSAGIVMLVIILEAVGVPVEGVALILGVDRILDMCRTATNVTGDAMVAVVVASTEGQLTSGANQSR